MRDCRTFGSIRGKTSIRDEGERGGSTRIKEGCMARPIETYGIGHVLFTDLEEVLSEHGGHIEVRIVRDEGRKDGALVYGVFYKDRHGRFFDVLQQRNVELKTFTRADTLVTALTRIGALENVALPALTEANVIATGSLRTLRAMNER